MISIARTIAGGAPGMENGVAKESTSTTAAKTPNTSTGRRVNLTVAVKTSAAPTAATTHTEITIPTVRGVPAFGTMTSEGIAPSAHATRYTTELANAAPNAANGIATNNNRR